MSKDKKDIRLAIAKYLKSKGWNVLVVGTLGVQKEPNSNKYNHQFFLNFTGGKQNERRKE